MFNNIDSTIHTSIQAFSVGMQIFGYYIIRSIRISVTRTGTPYITATLTDASGSVGMVCWDVDGTISPAVNGSIVFVCGTVGTYRDKIQLCVETMELGKPEELEDDELSAVIPCAPIDCDKYSRYIYNQVQSISNPEIRAICDDLLGNNWDLFSTIPAGMSIHHAFRCGLLMHTADMAMLADTIAEGNPHIDRDLLLAGVLLHDIGKLREFNVSPATGLVTDYTEEGNLIGHSVIGAMMIAEAGARTGAGRQTVLLLQHMLLAHHGDPASGAARQPMIIEAEILHDLDKTDSRAQMCAETLSSVPANCYTPQIPALGRRLYQHGMPDAVDAIQPDDDQADIGEVYRKPDLDSYDADYYDDPDDDAAFSSVRIHEYLSVGPDGGLTYSAVPEFL